MKHLSISLIILISFAISAESNDINTSGFEEKKTYITCSRGSARGYLPLGQKEAAKMKKVDEDVSKERLIIFQKAASELKMKFRRELFNKNSLVLFENKINNQIC